MLDDLVLVEEFRAHRAAVRAERHPRHRLDAARDHDIRLAGQDLHRGEIERLQPGGAHPVHARARHGLRESGDQRRQAADVHALLVDLRDASEDDIVDDLRLDSRAVYEGTQDERGEVVRSPILERSTALPNRRPHGSNDHGLRHGASRRTSWDA